MWCLMVVNAVALIQSAQGGYDYPKPSVPFELPNHEEIGGNGVEILKENNIDHKILAYFFPFDEYQYSQQHKNEESQQTIVGTDEYIQQNFNIIKQDQPHFLPTQLNSNEDTTVSIHNGISQSSAIKESNSINVQPLLSANCPQLVLNIKNKVPPLVKLRNSEYNIQNVQENSDVKLLDIQNQNVESILELKNNVLPLIKLNIDQVSSLNENILSQSINIPGIEQQLNDYSGDVQHLKSSSRQNVYNIIESPIINLRESVPQVLNPQNYVQTTSISDVQNIDEQVQNIRDNQIILQNFNDELSQPLNIQNLQAGITGESISQYNQQNIATPEITKSISFHVPPPDIEETPLISTVLPRKKVYKIIFIKAPTHEYQYNQQLQTALYNRLVPVEDKTIIYVLTKKPEELTEQVVQPQLTKVSEHEVIYVKYKGDETIESAPEGVNENISQSLLNSAGNAAVEPIDLVDH